MFVDGIGYAALAKNLSLGSGSIWQPHYSQTQFPVFYEHPAFAIYLQSLLFKFLGANSKAEQIYSLLMALGQFACVVWYWVRQSKRHVHALGLLLFIWSIIPLNHLYVSNQLENTLTLFTTIATLILLIDTKSKTTFLCKYVISATAIILAFFCNGPAALFPILTPLIQTIVIIKPKNVVNGIRNTLFLTGLSILLFAIVCALLPAAWINMQQYLMQQLLPSINGIRAPKFSGFMHLNIVLLYCRAYYLPSLFALVCLLIMAKMMNKTFAQTLKKYCSDQICLLFLILSLISSLPVGISHRQSFNYIMQSAPFFTITVAHLCMRPWSVMMLSCCEKNYKLFKAQSIIGMGMLFVSLVIVVECSNGFNRDKFMLQDINQLIHYFKPYSIISASPSVYYNWYTGAYFARWSMISLSNQQNQLYYIMRNDEAIPKKYHKIDLPLKYYTIARRR